MFYICFIIYLTGDGHMGCFHLLATVSNSAVNLGVQVGDPDFNSFG